MSSGLTGARSASEESMWRVHGRKGENLKLGNSCISVFSQIFHRNRSIGALGHKHIASRFHHSEAHAASAADRESEPLFKQVDGIVEPYLRDGAIRSIDNMTGIREDMNIYVQGHHVCREGDYSSRSELLNTIELRELLHAKQDPFILQDAIREKKQPVRMKSSRSLKEQPLKEIRSHRRRNSASDGDGRKTMQFELETNSSEAIVSSNSCVSIDGNLVQTSVLSGGSDSIHSKKTMRRRDRAPAESMVALPLSKSERNYKQAKNHEDVSMATPSTKNPTSKGSSNRKALLMEAASKILEGSNRSRSRRQLTSVRSLFADENNGRPKSSQDHNLLKSREKLLKVIQPQKAEFSKKEKKSDPPLPTKMSDYSIEVSMSTRSLKEKRGRIDRGGDGDGDGDLDLNRVLMSAGNEATLATSSDSVCRKFAVKDTHELKPRLLMEKEDMGAKQGATTKAERDMIASKTVKGEEDRYSCRDSNESPCSSSITSILSIVQGSPDHLLLESVRKVSAYDAASSTVTAQGEVSGKEREHEGKEELEQGDEEDDHFNVSALLSSSDSDSDSDHFKDSDSDLIVTPSCQKLCDFSWWEREGNHQVGATIIAAPDAEEEHLNLQESNTQLMSPVADEYGSDDCVSPTVTRNQLIPVKLLYEEGSNISKIESAQIPLSATVATSTYPCVEEFQQSSPVSVLDDAVFEDEEVEEDDEEEGANTMGSHLDCFEEAKQHWLEKVHRFEMLAKMDLNMLMKLAAEDEEEEEEEEEDEEERFFDKDAEESLPLNNTCDISSFTSDQIDLDSSPCSVNGIDQHSQTWSWIKEGPFNSMELANHGSYTKSLKEISLYDYNTKSLDASNAEIDSELYHIDEEEDDFTGRSSCEDGDIFDLMERFKEGRRRECNGLMACLLDQDEYADPIKSRLIFHPWLDVHTDILHDLGRPAVSSLLTSVDAILQESSSSDLGSNSSSKKGNDFRVEIEELGIEVERTLFSMLLHELLGEISSFNLNQ